MKLSLLYEIGMRFRKTKHVFFTQAEYDRFWLEPVWLSVQRQVAADIADWIDGLQKPDASPVEIAGAQASIAALQNVFGKTFLQNYIVRELKEEHVKTRDSLAKSLEMLDSIFRENA